jgi:hypothetical protein
MKPIHVKSLVNLERMMEEININSDFQRGIYTGLRMVQKWADIAKELDELKMMLRGAILVEEMISMPDMPE